MSSEPSQPWCKIRDLQPASERFRPHILLLKGDTGVGKSVFATFLQESHGFDHVSFPLQKVGEVNTDLFEMKTLRRIQRILNFDPEACVVVDNCTSELQNLSVRMHFEEFLPICLARIDDVRQRRSERHKKDRAREISLLGGAIVYKDPDVVLENKFKEIVSHEQMLRVLRAHLSPH